MSFTESFRKEASQVKSLRIVRFFRASDLRCGHEGLATYANSLGYGVNTLRPGEFLVFLNRAENRMKIMTTSGLLLYIKQPDERRFDLSIIKYLPRFFNGRTINYQNALTQMVMEKATKKKNPEAIKLAGS